MGSPGSLRDREPGWTVFVVVEQGFVDCTYPLLTLPVSALPLLSRTLLSRGPRVLFRLSSGTVEFGLVGRPAPPTFPLWSGVQVMVGTLQSVLGVSSDFLLEVETVLRVPPRTLVVGSSHVLRPVSRSGVLVSTGQDGPSSPTRTRTGVTSLDDRLGPGGTGRLLRVTQCFCLQARVYGAHDEGVRHSGDPPKIVGAMSVPEVMEDTVCPR